MKKLFLVPLALIFIIAGCADSNHNNVDTGTAGKVVPQTALSNLSVEDAILETSRRMYSTELSDKAKSTLLMIFNAVSTGYISEGQPINAGTLGGIGQMTNPYVASAVIQLFYHYASGGTVPGLTPDPNNPFKELLYYQNLEDDVAIAQALSNVKAMDSKTYAGIEAIFKMIVDSENSIMEIAKAYESKLLDSSSSASKTSGGGGAVLVDGYNVSANISYVIALFPIFGQAVLNTSVADVEQVAKSLYDFNEASKLKVTYDKNLVYFDIYEIASTDQMNNTLVPVLTDIIKNDISGGKPVKGDTDDETLNPSPYTSNTTDYYLTDNITTKLFGVPDEQYISNMAKNRTLDLHKKLRENGLKLPKEKTSDIGMANISETIAKYLRENGYVYMKFNKPTSTFQTDLTAIFTNQTGTSGEVKGTAVACKIIKEVNKAVDDSAKSYVGNTGYFVNGANGTLCDITIDPEHTLP